MHQCAYTCTRTCVCMHAPTDTWSASTLGSEEEAPSPALFPFVFLPPFLPSPGCCSLGCLQRAHHIPAVRNDVFIVVTTKDAASPPTLPPMAFFPQHCFCVPRSCNSSPRALPPPWFREGRRGGGGRETDSSLPFSSFPFLRVPSVAGGTHPSPSCHHHLSILLLLRENECRCPPGMLGSAPSLTHASSLI